MLSATSRQYEGLKMFRTKYCEWNTNKVCNVYCSVLRTVIMNYMKIIQFVDERESLYTSQLRVELTLNY